MKILKIFGIVVGIHVFALILIFANPGCSSTTKPPAPEQTAAKSDLPPPPLVAPPAAAPAPVASGSIYSSTTDATTATPLTFNPDAPAGTAPLTSGGARITPTRPGTPVAGVLVAEPEKEVTPATTYVVKAGDNLSTIAKKNGITTAQLTAANSLTAKSVLHPGQKLLIPAKQAPVSTGSTPAIKLTDTPAAAARTGNESMRHTVKSGETLGGIARKYGVRQGDLAEANSIADPAKIRPGMELTIPGWSSASGKKSGKSNSGAASKAPAISPPVAPAIEAPAATTPPPAPTLTPAPVPVIKIDEPAPKQP